METITQTNRTMLFAEVNPERLNLLTLIGDVRGRTSLDDDKMKETGTEQSRHTKKRGKRRRRSMTRISRRKRWKSRRRWRRRSQRKSRKKKQREKQRKNRKKRFLPNSGRWKMNRRAMTRRMPSIWKTKGMNCWQRENTTTPSHTTGRRSPSTNAWSLPTVLPP